MQGGYTMELCLTTYWSELKDISLSLKMTYHSIQPSTTELFFDGSCMWTNIHVTSAFSEEEIFPEFKLTHYKVSKRFVIGMFCL
jgi:hypothetical protein